MPKSSSPTFTSEFPLQTLFQQEIELQKRFDVSTYIFNACLGEALKRVDLIRQSRLWKEAKSLPKTKENTKKRKELFSQARKEHHFSEYSLHEFVKAIRKNCWFKDCVDSQVAQTLATRAFNTCKEYLAGKRGRPRFKRKTRFRSVEGKSNLTGLRYKEGDVLWGKDLKIKVLFDAKDPHGVEAYALQCRTKYTRIVRKNIRGKCLWYVQLVQEGRPLQKKKNKRKEGIIGLDIGPSSIAIVSQSDAHLAPFCEGLKPLNKEIKTLQKKMDRSRRKTNPNNYKEDGTIKKGPKKWVRSKRYHSLQQQVEEKHRILKETRKRMHGELANQVLAMGSICKLEKLSYKDFQKNFGKSVGFRAPGMFVSLLRRKAESAGGQVEEFSPYTTKLSQTCICGNSEKKSLSERWHECPCGASAQRDLFSAYLARFVSEDSLDTSQANVEWAATEPLLERAVSRLSELSNREDNLSSFGFNQRQRRSRAKGESFAFEAMDDVGNCREPWRESTTCL